MCVSLERNDACKCKYITCVYRVTCEMHILSQAYMTNFCRN